MINQQNYQLIPMMIFHFNDTGMIRGGRAGLALLVWLAVAPIIVAIPLFFSWIINNLASGASYQPFLFWGFYV